MKAKNHQVTILKHKIDKYCKIILNTIHKTIVLFAFFFGSLKPVKEVESEASRGGPIINRWLLLLVSSSRRLFCSFYYMIC